MTGPSITISIPLWNDALHLGTVLPTVLEAAQAITNDFEILLVNDGSTDGTEEVVADWELRHREVRSVHHASRLGYGAALRSGLFRATKEYVLYGSASLFSNLEQILKESLPLEDDEVVVGQGVDEPPRRVPAAVKISRWLLRVLYGVHARDPGLSITVLRRDLLERICPYLKAKTRFIETEALILASAFGARLREHSVRLHPSDWKVHSESDLAALWETIGYRFRHLPRALRAAKPGSQARKGRERDRRPLLTRR